jgi:site-specific recombinase XerD
MDITYSIYTDTTRANRSGLYPVYFIIRHPAGRFFVNSGLEAATKFPGRTFPRTEENARLKTTIINDRCTKIDKLLLSHEDRPWALDELKEEIRAIIKGKPKAQRTFADYVAEYAETCKAPATRTLYLITEKKVRTFDQRATFDTITPEWLRRFETHFLKTMTVNGLAIQLRNIRTVFNWAIDNDKTTAYPFRKFKIRQERTRHRALTPEQLITLRDYPVEPWQQEYRDIFMLCFYMRGINLVDLLALKPKDVRAGRINYVRSKTGKFYSIKIEPEMKKILGKYKGTEYLLDVCDGAKNQAQYESMYKGFLQRMDRGLKKIGPYYRKGLGGKKHITPLFPDISQYWCRHTTATLMAELGYSSEIIASSLGHEYGIKTTNIYIEYKQSEIDKANRALIDYVNKK